MKNSIDLSNFKIMKYFIFSFFFFNAIVCYSQINIKIEKDLSSPDYRVKISDDVISPDIRVKIGADIISEDFTVGITSNKNQANFIITESRYPDWSVRAADDVISPDLRIKAGDDVISPDIRIEVKKSGSVDYLIYTEKISLSIEEIVISLLPAINKFLEFKYEGIPILK